MLSYSQFQNHGDGESVLQISLYQLIKIIHQIRNHREDFPVFVFVCALIQSWGGGPLRTNIFTCFCIPKRR